MKVFAIDEFPVHGESTTPIEQVAFLMVSLWNHAAARP
jgi:hypothetical protein